MARVTEEAAAVFAQLGAELRDVRMPSLDQITRDAVQLCAVETAIAHAATYPARASEYGPVLAGHIDAGRQMSGLALGEIVQRREVFRGALAALFSEIDLLLLPAMNVAAPSLAWMAAAAGNPEARHARIRFTAPLDMSGSPSLTLPGGATEAGLPLGFQIVGRHLDEALILRAGHAYQQATAWHARRPPVD